MMSFNAITACAFNTNGDFTGYEANVTQNLLLLFESDSDTIVNEMICYIYLKTALDMNFLFDKDIYTDNSQVLSTLEASKKRLNKIHYGVLAFCLCLLFPAVIPNATNDDDYNPLLWLSLTTQLVLELVFFLVWLITLRFIQRKIEQQGQISPNKRTFTLHSGLLFVFLLANAVSMATEAYLKKRVNTPFYLTNAWYNIASVHDVCVLFEVVLSLAIYGLVVYVLFPKQEKDEEAEELRFLAMLGFKDFDDMKDALINNFDGDSTTRHSREVILSTTIERIRILMNKTESSRSVIDNFVNPEFGFSTYNFAFSRTGPS